MSTNFQDAMNDNMGTLHHLGALAASQQAKRANEQRQALLRQQDEVARNQEVLIEVEKEKLKIEQQRLSLEKEARKLEADKSIAIKSFRKTLANAASSLERIESDLGI